jgi:hypothetical protein
MTTHLKQKPALANVILWLAMMASSLSPAIADNVFSLSSDGREVTDSRTGLIWQRCPVGMYWNAANANCAGTASYFMWYQSLHVAVNTARSEGLAWRLPNVKELASIVDKSVSNPAINDEVFPTTPNHQFWTATPFRNDAFFAWLVDFYDGAVLYSYLEDMGALRLVRDPG